MSKFLSINPFKEIEDKFDTYVSENTEIVDECERYTSLINIAAEDTSLLIENFSFSDMVLEGSAIDKIKDAFNTAWEKIKAFFRWMGNKLSEFINSIKNFFKSGAKSLNFKSKESSKDSEAKIRDLANERNSLSAEIKKHPEKKAELTKKINKINEEIRKETAKGNLNKKSEETQTRKVYGTAGKRVFSDLNIKVNDVIDFEKFDISKHAESISKNVKLAIENIKRHVNNEGKSAINFADYREGTLKSIEIMQDQMEKATVEELNITISNGNFDPVLKRLEQIKKDVDAVNKQLDSFDSDANEITKNSDNNSVAKALQYLISNDVIKPFTKIGNTLMQTANKLFKAVSSYMK